MKRKQSQNTAFDDRFVNKNLFSYDEDEDDESDNS
jgi:hypothetical protein